MTIFRLLLSSLLVSILGIGSVYATPNSSDKREAERLAILKAEKAQIEVKIQTFKHSDQTMLERYQSDLKAINREIALATNVDNRKSTSTHLSSIRKKHIPRIANERQTVFENWDVFRNFGQ